MPKTEPWMSARVFSESYSDAEPDGSNPNVFIQWKGTDVCFDFWCPCGDGGHFDGYFAYTFICPGCRTTYAMPSTIYPLKVEAADHQPVELQRD